MSLAISSLSLLPALFNALHSCLNNLVSATLVFNSAPLTALNSATSVAKTLQLQHRINLEVLDFTLASLLHPGFGGRRDREATWWGFRGCWSPARIPSVAGQYYTATSELREKVKMGKTAMLPGLCSSTATAIKRLVFSPSKSTNPVLGKASQERALRLLG